MRRFFGFDGRFAMTHPLSLHAAPHNGAHAGGTPMPAVPQPLSACPTGQRCRVHAVGGSGLMRRRLMDLGVMPDAEITLLRVAPLNDPIEIRVGNAFVSLRRSEAALIDVLAL